MLTLNLFICTHKIWDNRNYCQLVDGSQNHISHISVYVKNASVSKSMSFFSEIVIRVTIILYMWFKPHYPYILLIKIKTTTFILRTNYLIK